MSITDDFFEGSLCPAYRKADTPRSRKALKENDELLEKLKPDLSKKQNEHIEKIIDNHFIIEYEYGKEMFKKGFSIGLRLAAEAFSE